MELSKAKELIWNDVYTHRFMENQPSMYEMINYIFWKETLTISKRSIDGVKSTDWETIDRISITEHTHRWDMWFNYGCHFVRPENLFLTYEECLINLEKKIDEWQAHFQSAYWGWFCTKIVLDS